MKLFFYWAGCFLLGAGLAQQFFIDGTLGPLLLTLSVVCLVGAAVLYRIDRLEREIK